MEDNIQEAPRRGGRHTHTPPHSKEKNKVYTQAGRVRNTRSNNIKHRSTRRVDDSTKKRHSMDERRGQQ
eukprot:10555571-Prorocentrum_lima.AAC.1